MKKTILILFLLIPIRLLAPADTRLPLAREEALNPFNSLWNATCKVESNYNPLAINENEQAYGISQIRPIRIKDYNERTGSNYSLPDCLDSALSRKIYMFYAARCGPYEIEKIAKSWNGSGSMTEDYWKRIKEIL